MALFFKDSFYELAGIQSDNDKRHVYAKLKVNIDHPVFIGHFPDQPVVPGVLMIQMVSEILSEFINHEVNVRQIKNVKYISLINPTVHRVIEIKIDIVEEHLDSMNINAVVDMSQGVVICIANG